MDVNTCIKILEMLHGLWHAQEIQQKCFSPHLLHGPHSPLSVAEPELAAAGRSRDILTVAGLKVRLMLMSRYF